MPASAMVPTPLTDTSFTETMTGIVETVTKSLKPNKKDKQPAAEATASTSAMAIESSPATDGSWLLVLLIRF